MDATITYETQQIWTSWFAVYLYLGGLGAATLTVTFLTDMYLRPYKELVLWGAFSGIVMLGAGSGLLFWHLLDHMAAIHVMSPLVLFEKPDAWIAWGTQFISWMMIWGFVYAFPYMAESAFLRGLPVLGWILGTARVQFLAAHAGKHFRRTIGWLATVNGIGVAVYTGLVLQSFPAVTLWHNPGVPLLFTASAFSTALAYLLLVLHLVMNREEDHPIRVIYERIDLILISTELVILFSFFTYLQSGSESGYRSAELLWGDLGWMVGFIGFGLVVPFFLQLKGVIWRWPSRYPIVASAVLVLGGGYLLRHYFMEAAVFAYPG